MVSRSGCRAHYSRRPSTVNNQCSNVLTAAEESAMLMVNAAPEGNTKASPREMSDSQVAAQLPRLLTQLVEEELDRWRMACSEGRPCPVQPTFTGELPAGAEGSLVRLASRGTGPSRTHGSRMPPASMPSTTLATHTLDPDLRRTNALCSARHKLHFDVAGRCQCSLSRCSGAGFECSGGWRGSLRRRFVPPPRLTPPTYLRCILY